MGNIVGGPMYYILRDVFTHEAGMGSAPIALSPVIGRLAQDFFRDPDRQRPRDTDYSDLLTLRDGE